MTHPILSSIFLYLAAAIALIFTIGLAVMRDPLQRLHFSAPIVCFCPLFICVAVFLENADPAARIKVVIISVMLFLMNSILTHATSKAVRIREAGQWPVQIKEGIPLVNRNVPAGDNQEKPPEENPV
ncbi:MAG TPA: monovalent cation/H(+) antiporter subunit G [Tepidisphaeraceae bacterium]|nr:monovalent cation/H(+) antiporter subunit G [Tepidisphaeraceae bacterium]